MSFYKGAGSEVGSEFGSRTGLKNEERLPKRAAPQNPTSHSKQNVKRAASSKRRSRSGTGGVAANRAVAVSVVCPSKIQISADLTATRH
jgi:hypothetical protein